MTTWEATQARIVQGATELTPLKVLITVLSFPFFALGWLIGAIWFVARLVWQAGWVGAQTAQHTLKRT